MSKILITADWHIRGDRPRCRVDEDWLETQRRDIRAVSEIAWEEKVREVWILGDLFHQPRVSTEALNMVLSELLDIQQNHTVRILPGNHDLPYHDYGNLECSSIGVVLKSFGELDTEALDNLKVYAVPFGMEDEGSPEFKGADIWVTHQLTFPDDATRPIKGVGVTAQELLDKFPGRLVLTGDYHNGYVYTAKDGRQVGTPGCLNIQAADLSEYFPQVLILDTDTLDITTRVLPPRAELVVTDYLVAEKERDERMEKVLQVVGDGSTVSLSFRDNLENIINSQEFKPATDVYPELLDRLNKDRQ